MHDINIYNNINKTIISLLLIFSCQSYAWQDFISSPVRTTQEHGQRVIPIDIDFDGDIDLITSYSLTDEVVLEINTGNNTWQMQQIGNNIVAMFAQAADFDGDGDLDIAAIGLFDRNLGFNNVGKVIWYEQNGALNNWIPHSIDITVIHPRYLDIADIDNDGDMDIAIVSSGQDENGEGFGNVALWYRNDSNGSSFTRWIIASGLDNPESIRIGNIDNDNTMDVIVSEYGGDRVLWYASENNANKNNWTQHTISSNLSSPSSSRFYDMDNDNDLDVVTAFDSSSPMTWFEHPTNLNNAWVPHQIGNNVNEIVDFVRADFNHDGLLDFAIASFINGNLSVLEQLSGGLYAIHSYAYSSITSAEAADLDGNGSLDIVTSSYSDNRVDWWINNHAIIDLIFENSFE